MERDLAETAAETRLFAGRPLNVLVIGCGLFHEAPLLPPDSRCTLLDLDPRVIDLMKTRSTPLIKEARVVTEKFTPEELGEEFDLIYGKEVVEHLPEPSLYLAKTLRALRPGGVLWLSTPNYGEPWLPLVEKTFLELVARLSGFTRKGIHPSPFSRKTLENCLTRAGFQKAKASTVSLRLGLVSRAYRPAGGADGK